MPIPDFNENKAPALQFTDGNTHKIVELYEALLKHFNSTEDEQNEMLPSGVQRSGIIAQIGPATTSFVIVFLIVPREEIGRAFPHGCRATTIQNVLPGTK